MKRTFIWTILAAMVLLFAGSASGEIYRWVDENGVTHFSDRKPLTSDDSKVHKVSPDSGTLSVVPEKSQPLTLPTELTPSRPTEVQLNRNARVEIYTTNW